MPDFLVVMVFLISSVVGIPQATGKFVQHFPGWDKADQVKVSCNNTVIAQYCHNQRCPKINKPGVLLEKGIDGVYRLTITNCSYDSRSCEAVSYIDDQQQAPETFTVHDCNQQTRTSPNPESTSASPNPESTSASPNPESTSASPNPGNNQSHSGPIAAGVTTVIGLLLICVFFVILYMKVKCFKKAIDGVFSRLQRNNRNPNQEPDIELKENFLSSV